MPTEANTVLSDEDLEVTATHLQDARMYLQDVAQQVLMSVPDPIAAIGIALNDNAALCATVKALRAENERILKLYNESWLWVQQRVKHPNSGLPPAAMTLIEMLPLLNQRAIELCVAKADEYKTAYPEAAHALRAVAEKLEALK